MGALLGAAIAGTAVIRRLLDDLEEPRGTGGS